METTHRSEIHAPAQNRASIEGIPPYTKVTKADGFP